MIKEEQEENAVKVRMIPLKPCSFLNVYRCTEKYYFNKITGKCEQHNNVSSYCLTES